MNQAIIFLLETFLGLLSLALLLRFYLQVVRAPARNPLSYFLAALTEFIVRPVRPVMPGLRGYEVSTLLLAWPAPWLRGGAVLSLRGSQLGPGLGSGLACRCAAAAGATAGWGSGDPTWGAPARQPWW